MQDKDIKEKNMKTATSLAEFILLPIHAKMNVLPNPLTTRGFVESQGERRDWEARSWEIEISNSDFGKETIHISDRFSLNVVVLAQEIAYRAYRKLLEENASQEMIDHIYSNTNIWSKKLQEIEIK